MKSRRLSLPEIWNQGRNLRRQSLYVCVSNSTCLADCKQSQPARVPDFIVYSIDYPDSAERSEPDTGLASNKLLHLDCFIQVQVPGWVWPATVNDISTPRIESYNSQRYWNNIFLQSLACLALLMEICCFPRVSYKNLKFDWKELTWVFASSEWSFTELRLSVFYRGFLDNYAENPNNSESLISVSITSGLMLLFWLKHNLMCTIAIV